MGVTGRNRLAAAAAALAASAWALGVPASGARASAPAHEARPSGASASAVQASAHDSARLASARITIDLAGDTARVEAEYRFAREETPPESRFRGFTALRLRGQTLRIEGSGARPALTALPGLWRVRLIQRVQGAREGSDSSMARGPHGAELRYRLVGRIDRIPLFVPVSRTLSTGGRFTIVVRNAPPGLDPGSAFPRFELDGEGALVARPSELPGFVQLPRAGAPLGIGTAADAGVALSLLAGLGGWALLRHRTRAGSPRGASDPAGPSRSSA